MTEQNKCLVTGDDLNHVMTRLRALPEETQQLEREMVAYRAEAETHKRVVLAQAEEAGGMAVLAASLDAPQDGKNADERKRQMDWHLAHSEAIVQAQVQIARVERELADKKTDADLCEVDVKAKYNETRAMLALADLYSRVLTARETPSYGRLMK